MKKQKKLVPVVIFLLIVIFGVSNVFAAGDVIRIGMPHPVTGDIAFLGKNTINAAKLAVKQINEKGGILGKKVELVVEDGKCSPSEALTAFKKMKRDGVTFFQGGLCSGATLAIMPTIKDGSALIISSSSSSPSIPPKCGVGGNDYVFTLFPSDAKKMEILTKAMKEDGIKTVAILAVNNDYGRDAGESAKKWAGKYGLNIVMEEYFKEGEVNFLSILTKVKGLKADAILLTAYIQAGSKILNQMHELGLWGNIALYSSGEQMGDETFRIMGGGDPQKGIKRLEGLREVAPWDVSLGDVNPKAKKFVEDYAAEYKGELPVDVGAMSYLVMDIFFEAIKNAGSLDITKVKDKVKASNYDSFLGPVKFDEYNHLIPTLFLKVIKNGQITILKSYFPE
jgi:branched-chain amino acid transport system substrate-binding protein